MLLWCMGLTFAAEVSHVNAVHGFWFMSNVEECGSLRPTIPAVAWPSSSFSNKKNHTIQSLT